MTCQTREAPRRARLLKAGSLLRGRAALRALMVCACRGQRGLSGFPDRGTRDGESTGRGISAPGPDARDEDACAPLPARDADALRPRVVVPGAAADRIDRAA